MVTVPPTGSGGAESEPGEATGEPAGPGAGLGRHIVQTVVGNTFPPLAALVTAPVLARGLGVDERGQLAAGVAPYLLLSVVGAVGLPDAATYLVARRPAAARSGLAAVLRLLTAAGILATVLAVVLAGRLSGGSHAVAELVVVGSLSITPTLWLGALRGVAAGLKQWDVVAREKLLSSALRLAAIVALDAVGRLTPLTAALVLTIGPLVGIAAYARLLARLRRGTPDGTGAETTAETTGVAADSRQLARYGSRIWIGAIAGILLSRLDQTLVTPLSGTFALGLYTVAVNVSEVPLIINDSVRDVVFSADSTDSETVRLTRAARLSTLACALVGVLIAGTLPLWLGPLFGAGFRPALDAAWVLIAAVVLGTPGSVAGAGLSARGRPGLRSLSLLVACVLNVVLLVLLLPPLGALGAALATLAGNVLSSHLNIQQLRRHFGVPVRDFYGLRRTDREVVTAVAHRGVAGLGVAALRVRAAISTRAPR